MKTVSNIKTFRLVRDADESGISGTGVVAEGVEFTGGAVVITWFSHFPAFNVYPGGMKTVEGLHGHNGKTRVEWDHCGTCRSLSGVALLRG